MTDRMTQAAKSVNELWMKTCEGVVSYTLALNWWHVLKQHYEEGHRYYHTLEHIYDMCKFWNEYKYQLKAPKDIVFAILFHEYVMLINKHIICLLYESGFHLVEGPPPPKKKRGREKEGKEKERVKERERERDGRCGG